MATAIRAIVPPPPAGLYWVNIPGATGAATYPETGRGPETEVGNDALWGSDGLIPLAAGTFTVVIESVILDTATTLVTITELHAGAGEVIFEGIATVPMEYTRLNIPMRDGFSFETAGTLAGCIITFRIHLHGA